MKQRHLSDEAAAADAGPPSPIVARIDRVQAAVAQAAQALAEQQGRSSQERDRSWIARSIIRVFVVAVAAVLVILAVQGLVTKEWQNVTAQATDLIKSPSCRSSHWCSATISASRSRTKRRAGEAASGKADTAGVCPYVCDP